MTQKEVWRIMRCINLACQYESLMLNIWKCKYCGSKLEIIASTNKMEVIEIKI